MVGYLEVWAAALPDIARLAIISLGSVRLGDVPRICHSLDYLVLGFSVGRGSNQRGSCHFTSGRLITGHPPSSFNMQCLTLTLYNTPLRSSVSPLQFHSGSPNKNGQEASLSFYLRVVI